MNQNGLSGHKSSLFLSLKSSNRYTVKSSETLWVLVVVMSQPTFSHGQSIIYIFSLYLAARKTTEKISGQENTKNDSLPHSLLALIFTFDGGERTRIKSMETYKAAQKPVTRKDEEIFSTGRIFDLGHFSTFHRETKTAFPYVIGK